MGALNGDFFKEIIDSVNAVLEGFNKLSKPTAIMNIASIITTNINVFVPFINHFFFIVSINLFGFFSF